LNKILNNQVNIKPSNATFNSSLQNRPNIYSIGSDFNSPHIINTDENMKNIKSLEDLIENDIENYEENKLNNNYQEQFEFNTYEENENEDLINQQTPTNENEEILDKNKYLFFKKENLYKKNDSNIPANDKNKCQCEENIIANTNKINLPNESLLMYSKNIINKKNLISKNQKKASNKSNYYLNGDSNSEHNYLISQEEQQFSNKDKNSNNDITQKIKNLDLSRLKNSMHINNISNMNNINDTNSAGFDFFDQVKNSNENNDLNLDLSLGLKQRKSKDKVLFDSTNYVNNIENKTLSHQSSNKINNNKNFIFNSDKDINNSNLQNKGQNISGEKGYNNIQGIIKKRSSISQLNTSDTSFNKLNEMKSKLKNNKFLIGNKIINSLTNNKELNNFSSNDFKNFPGENKQINALENDKYLFTNNTNEGDYSTSEIGFLSGSNKVDSNGVSRNNRNKFINLEKNFLQTYMENLNANNLIKKYQNLNELGEILDDSKEKNLKSESKEENNKNSLSFVCFEKYTQTSFDKDFYNQSAENSNETDEADLGHNIKKTDSKLCEIIKNYYYNEDCNNNAIDSVTRLKLKKEIRKKDKIKLSNEFKLHIVNDISDEFIINTKKIKSLRLEDITKNFVLENSSKILDYLPDEYFCSDLRFLKLKKDYDNLQAENERLILNESELLKTTTIFKDYIKTQEVITNN
jgi:hypothetical protein